MTTTSKQNTDELLAQAICAIFVRDSKATAWLFSEEGHLLTVGHLFADSDPPDMAVDVQFLDESRIKARKLYRIYNQQAGHDFAILKIEDPDLVVHRIPLPVALVKTVEGKWKLQGYGKTLGSLSGGRGEFLGPAVLASSDDFFFKLDSKQTGEPGFSGSPIFSENLQAVVGIQTEATNAQLGAERDTVLAVPLLRIARQWSKFRLLVNEKSARLDEEKYKSPKLYLEDRIKSAYANLRSSQEEAAEVASSELLETKYSHGINLYLRIYFQLLKRLRRPAHPDILKIASEFPAGQPEELQLLGAGSPPQIYTNLPGPRVTLGVSQMFRIADLLTRPESVKARQFYEAITNMNKLRRTLTGRKSFRLGALGSLRSVIKKSDAYNSFWMPAVPNWRLPTVQPLCFLPYELSLMTQLRNLHLRYEDDATLASLTNSASIRNSQISGRLRIYPPGIGVISLNLALEFKDEVPIELIAQISHNIEELLFVGPNDQRPFNALMLKIIDRVIDNLFLDEGFSYENRRWTPPVTTFSFPEGQGLAPQECLSELAYLMSLAPANNETLEHLQARMRGALRTPRWTQDRILAVAGQGVALFLVDDRDTTMLKQRRQSFRVWLTETHELIAAAAYAQKAFAEEVEGLLSQRQLDSSWLPGGDRFSYLKSLLETMQQVMRAIASIGSPQGHLHNQGAGALMTFAKDVWTYSNPVDRESMEQGLSYVADWLSSVPNAPREILDLRSVVDGILKISSPFFRAPESKAGKAANAQSHDLGSEIPEMYTELEQMLREYEPEEFAEGKHQKVMQELREQLGL